MKPRLALLETEAPCERTCGSSAAQRASELRTNPLSWRALRIVEIDGRERAGPLVWLADSVWTRARGVLGRSALLRVGGCWLHPCRAVHGFGLRQALDVLFIADDGRILAIQRLAPGRIACHFGARSVLELDAGQTRAWGLRCGQRLSSLAVDARTDQLDDPRSVLSLPRVHRFDRLRHCLTRHIRRLS
ncbi:MAG: DUF192 domain-containing protein [Burkholderiaceae bacterium]